MKEDHVPELRIRTWWLRISVSFLPFALLTFSSNCLLIVLLLADQHFTKFHPIPIKL